MLLGNFVKNVYSDYHVNQPLRKTSSIAVISIKFMILQWTKETKAYWGQIRPSARWAGREKKKITQGKKAVFYSSKRSVKGSKA